MPQELHVLRCFACGLFQVHIVKKIRKWECKVCLEKQSVKQVYGRGSGKDCRLHVQKLNALRGQQDEEAAFAAYECEITDEPSAGVDDQKDSVFVAQTVSGNSKWNQFLDKPQKNDEDEDNREEDDYGAFGTKAKVDGRFKHGLKRKESTVFGKGKYGKFMNKTHVDDFAEAEQPANEYRHCLRDVDVPQAGWRESQQGWKSGICRGKRNRNHWAAEDHYENMGIVNDNSYSCDSFGEGFKTVRSSGSISSSRTNEIVVTRGNVFTNVVDEVNYNSALENSNGDKFGHDVISRAAAASVQNNSEKKQTNKVGVGKWGKFLDLHQNVDEGACGNNTWSNKSKHSVNVMEKLHAATSDKWSKFLDPPNVLDDSCYGDSGSNRKLYGKSELEYQKLIPFNTPSAVVVKCNQGTQYNPPEMPVELHHGFSDHSLRGKCQKSRGSCGVDSQADVVKKQFGFPAPTLHFISSCTKTADDNDLDEILKL